MVYFRRFFPFAEKRLGFREPAEFLGWAKRQVDVVAVEEAIESFAKTQPRSSQHIVVAALKTFLERNGYKGLPGMETERPRKVFYRGYRREEIQRLLGFLDDGLEKLYVLFAKDSGLRANTILSLRYHHVKPDLEAGRDFCHLYLEPEYFESKKTAGITFIGPNTVKVLRELVQKERVQANSERCDPDHPERCGCAKIFPFHYTTITGILNLAMEKAGLDPKIQPSHGLRKFFENCLDKVEPALDIDKKRQLEGHSLGVRWNYTEQDAEVLRPMHKQAYQFLDLSEEAAVSAEMKGVKQQLVAQEREIARLRAIVERMGPLRPLGSIVLESKANLVEQR